MAPNLASATHSLLFRPVDAAECTMGGTSRERLAVPSAEDTAEFVGRRGCPDYQNQSDGLDIVDGTSKMRFDGKFLRAVCSTGC